MKCSKCNQENQDRAKFCAECGEKMSVSIQTRQTPADISTLCEELKILFEKDENAYWAKMTDISEQDPGQFITVSSVILNDEALKNDPVLRLLRGRSFFKKAFALFKSYDDQLNEESLNLLEEALIDYKIAYGSRDKKEQRAEIDNKIELNLDTVATLLERHRPGRVQSLLGKIKLKYLDDRVYTWNSQFTPSEQEMNILNNIFFEYSSPVGSAMIFSKVLGQPGQRHVNVVLYKETTGPKNETGQSNEIQCIIQLSENGTFQIIDDFGKNKAIDYKNTSAKQVAGPEPRLPSAQEPDNYIAGKSPIQTSVKGSENKADIKADLKKAAGDTYSKLLAKSKVLKNAIASGNYKKALNNEFIKKTFAWFRVSDERLRIPIYIIWGYIVFGLMSIKDGNLMMLLNPALVMSGIMMYGFSFFVRSSEKFRKVLTSRPGTGVEGLFGLVMAILYLIPAIWWWVFCWPAEKLYSWFFYKYTCLSMGIGYLQCGDYSNAVKELEKAKVSKKETEGQEILYASLGDAYAGLERYTDAIKAYNQALQFSSDPANINMDLAYCLMMEKQFDEALRLFRDNMNNDPNNNSNYLGLSRCYLSLEMYGDALSYLRQALSLEPQNANTHKMLAEAYMGQGDEAEALKEAQFALNLNPEPNIAEEAQEIINYIKYGPSVRESEEENSEIPEIKAVPVAAKVGLLPGDGIDRLADGGHDKINTCNTQTADLQIVTNSDRQTANDYLEEGLTYFQNDDLYNAEESFNRAVSLNPKMSRAYSGLGTIAFMRQNHAAAIDFYIKALELEPQNAKYLARLADLYSLRGDSENALRYAKEALAIDTKTWHAHSVIAGEMTKKDVEKAAAYLTKICEENSPDVIGSDGLMSFAGAYELIGEEVLHKIDPENNNSNSLALLNIEAWDRSVKLNPNNTRLKEALSHQVYTFLGFCEDFETWPMPLRKAAGELRIGNDYKSAIYDFFKACDLDPKLNEHKDKVLMLHYFNRIIHDIREDDTAADGISSQSCVNQDCNKSIPSDSIFCGYCGTKVVLS